MGQTSGSVELKSFSGGLVTEVSPMNGDISTTSELSNWLLNKDGSLEARRKLVKVGDIGLPVTTTTDDYKTFIWERPSGRSTPILCIFNVYKAAFYDINADGSIGARIHYSNETWAYAGSQTSVTEAAGKLIIGGRYVNYIQSGSYVGDNTHMYVVNYDSEATTPITITQADITINDLFGADDRTPPNQNPQQIPYVRKGEMLQDQTDTAYGTITDPYSVDYLEKYYRRQYNKVNQGFTKEMLTQRTGGSVYEPYGIIGISVPSLGLDASGAFEIDVLAKALVTIGRTPAPIGRVTLNLTNRGDSRSDYVESLGYIERGLYRSEYNNGDNDPTKRNFIQFRRDNMPLDRSDRGIFITSSHQGRVFYGCDEFRITDGDEKSPDINSMIFYSQSVVGAENFINCSTTNDPTSSDEASVLDTDGGFIIIQGMGSVKSFYSLGSSLIVSAANGLWEISSTGIFTGSNYAVRKLTSDSIVDEKSVVIVGDMLLYWALSGIKSIVPEKQRGYLSATDLSKGVIDTYYSSVLGDTLLCSIYNERSNEIRWCHKSNDVYKELVFDTTLKAFYTNTLTELDTATKIPVMYLKQDDVVGDSNIGMVVTDTSLDEGGIYYFSGDKSEASLTTNVSTFGDVTKRKACNYLTMLFRQTEKTQDEVGLLDQSSCLTTASWDYADNVSSNKFSRQFEAYRLRRVNVGATSTYTHGHSVISTRNKVRGSGKALSVKCVSPENKACHLYGMHLDILSTTNT
jgi:hypothetical protein